MLREAKYPFAVDLRSYARLEADYYGPIEALLGDEESLELARAWLEASVKGGDAGGATAWETVLGFHAAAAAVAKSGSPRLARRFSEYVARRTLGFLDSEARETLLWLASRIGVEAQASGVEIPWLYNPRSGVIPRVLQYSVGLPSYLSIASGLEGAEWRLANSFLRGGRVYMDKRGFTLFLSAAVRAYVEAIIREYSDIEAPGLEELGKKYSRMIDLDEYDPSLAPDCIREIIEAVREGRATDEALYTLVTFLANARAPPEYLEEILASTHILTPAQASMAARILLEEAARYRPLNCKALLESNTCTRCRGRGPLSEYWRLRRARASRRDAG